MLACVGQYVSQGRNAIAKTGRAQVGVNKARVEGK